MWLCHEAPVTASLSHSQLQISISKCKCLTLHSSVRKLLWSPGVERASRHNLWILTTRTLPPPKKKIKGEKENTVWLPLAYNNNNNLEITGGSSTLHTNSCCSQLHLIVPETAEITVFSLAIRIVKMLSNDLKPLSVKTKLFALLQFKLGLAFLCIGSIIQSLKK